MNALRSAIVGLTLLAGTTLVQRVAGFMLSSFIQTCATHSNVART
jgi:hypothetical protein